MRKVFVCMMLLATVCFTGCSGKSEAVRLLEDKYNEKFSVIEKYGDGSVLAVSEEDHDALFEAKVIDDGKYIVDEYVTARVCSQIKDKIFENLGNPSEEDIVVKVTAVSKTIDSTDADMTPEEYMAIKSKNEFVIDICYYYGAFSHDELVTKAFSGMPYLKGYADICATDKEIVGRVRAYFGKSARADYGYEKILDDEYIERMQIY